MPKFFIHINQPDELILDPEGMNFHDLEAAREMAKLCILELAMEDLKGDQPLETVSLQICDKAGRLLAEVFSEDVWRHLLRGG